MQRLGVPFQNTANTGLHPSLPLFPVFPFQFWQRHFLTVNSGTHLEMSIWEWAADLKTPQLTSFNSISEVCCSLALVFLLLLHFVAKITHDKFYWHAADFLVELAHEGWYWSPIFAWQGEHSAQWKPFVRKYLRSPEGVQDHTDVYSKHGQKLTILKNGTCFIFGVKCNTLP
jgi:hypothetical protein